MRELYIYIYIYIIIRVIISNIIFMNLIFLENFTPLIFVKEYPTTIFPEIISGNSCYKAIF